MNDASIQIDGRRIGAGAPCYVIAEMSANHGHDFTRAVRLVEAARDAGADALKVQTYTPDSITIDADNEYFRIKGGGIGVGRTLYDLYRDAYTPWDWQGRLQEAAQDLGLDFFSTPFDETAVDFLETLRVPAYKIASFEVVDVPLLRKVAATGKPIIMSTGMATLDEIEEALESVGTARERMALLKCTSAYPAPVDEMHLRTIPDMVVRFRRPVGLSDHSLSEAVPIAAVALGATILEKHLTLSRADSGPDSGFSLEPDEFRAVVKAVRVTERALGSVCYDISQAEADSRAFRRSLFVVQDVEAGEPYTRENVRSIRPGAGLHTRHLDEVLGRRAACDVCRGTPLDWTLVK
jgi:N-acetylneuraminate synthase